MYLKKRETKKKEKKKEKLKIKTEPIFIYYYLSEIDTLLNACSYVYICLLIFFQTSKQDLWNQVTISIYKVYR